MARRQIHRKHDHSCLCAQGSVLAHCSSHSAVVRHHCCSRCLRAPQPPRGAHLNPHTIDGKPSAASSSLCFTIVSWSLLQQQPQGGPHYLCCTQQHNAGDRQLHAMPSLWAALVLLCHCPYCPRDITAAHDVSNTPRNQAASCCHRERSRLRRQAPRHAPVITAVLCGFKVPAEQLLQRQPAPSGAWALPWLPPPAASSLLQWQAASRTAANQDAAARQGRQDRCGAAKVNRTGSRCLSTHSDACMVSNKCCLCAGHLPMLTFRSSQRQAGHSRICGGASTPCSPLPTPDTWWGSQSSRACTAQDTSTHTQVEHTAGEHQQQQRRQPRRGCSIRGNRVVIAD